MIYRGGAEHRTPEGPTVHCHCALTSQQPDGAIANTGLACTHTVTLHAALHGQLSLPSRAMFHHGPCDGMCAIVHRRTARIGPDFGALLRSETRII